MITETALNAGRPIKRVAVGGQNVASVAAITERD
jgi:hypothetical protein